MKKRAVCIILGVLLTGAMFTGCGKNKATEAASESAQTEKEGVGEDVRKILKQIKNLIKILRIKILPPIRSICDRDTRCNGDGNSGGRNRHTRR